MISGTYTNSTRKKIY